MEKVLALAARYPGTFTVYGYTALRHWIAPHLRRLPADLDLIAAVHSAEEFQRICQEVAGALDNVHRSEQVHDGVLTCHMRCGAIKVLVATDVAARGIDISEEVDTHIPDASLEAKLSAAREALVQKIVMDLTGDYGPLE